MVFSNKHLIKNIIHLNDKIKNNADQKKALHILQQMRLLVNHMTLNLHDLNKDIYNENNGNSENEKYYYMTMYESLINSIKSMISMYENNLLNNDNNDENIDMMNLENNTLELQDVNIGEKQKIDFLDELKKVNGNDSFLFNPQNLIEQMQLKTLKDKVKYDDNLDDSNNIFGTNSSKSQLDTLFANTNVNDSKDISNNLDPLFNNNQTENRIDPLFTEVSQQTGNPLDSLFANDSSVQKSNPLKSLFSNNNDQISNFNNIFSETEVAKSIFGNLHEENANIMPKKKIKIVLVLNNKLPITVDNVWNDFEKLDKSECIKLDANKHSDYAENLGFDFEKDFELKKIEDGDITNFEDEITLDKLVKFSKEKDSGYESDVEDLMQSIDYDNTLTLYHNPNCGYCIEFYPIWDQLTDLCKNKPIQLLKVDCNDNSSMCSHILGTPTVIFKNIHSSKTMEFEGEKTIDDLMKFIDININLASLDNCSSCGRKHKNTECNRSNNIIDIMSQGMQHDMNQNMDQELEQHIHDDMHQGMDQGMDQGMHYDMHHDMHDDMHHDMHHDMHQGMDQRMHQGMHDDVFEFEPDNSNMLDANKPIIIFYHKNDCKYSRNFDNTWNQLQQELGDQVLFVKKNYDELNEEMKDRLSHVPTIELMLDLHKDNKIYRYGNSNRSVPELIKFIRNPELGQLTPLDSFSSQNGGYANNDYFTINRMQNMYGGDKGKIILFYADWCGHCQQFKPVWEKIKRKMGGKVQFEEVDDENVFEINKYGVQSYPTIIAEKGGKMFKFNNNRTEDILIDFIEEKLM